MHQAAIVGKWKIQGVAQPVDITMNGTSVSSVQKPFGNEPLMAEIEETSEKLLGCFFFFLHSFFSKKENIPFHAQQESPSIQS